MEVLWNKINLERPPYRSWENSPKEFDSKKFFETIQYVLRDFKILEVLHSEAALLSRLIYRMKCKFRSDKGLKNMEKVNRALLNYLNMSMQREYELLNEYSSSKDGTVSLPSKQMLQYVLVRTQGFAKLMSRIESTAHIAGNFLRSRLQIGQSWTVAMIAYTVVSRIWVISRYIIKRVCEWYNQIYSHMKNFKIVGMKWLPETYILPKNLVKWMNLSWFNEDLENIPMKENWNKSIFSLINANNNLEENFGNIDDLIVENTKLESNLTVIKQSEPFTNKNIDLGELIVRDSFEAADEKPNNKGATKKVKKKKAKLLKNQEENKEKLKDQECTPDIEDNKKSKRNKTKKTSEKCKLLNIQSEKDLVKLLKANSCPGYDKLQWKILQKRIKKLLIKLTKNNTSDINDTIITKVKHRIECWTSSS